MPYYTPKGEPHTFAEVAGHVVPSVVAIAIGTDEASQPNVVGTGFAAEFSEMFVTCWHVAAEQEKVQSLAPAKLKKRGLVDGVLRIGLRTPDGGYVWRQPPPFTWFRFGIAEQDICIFRAVGVAVPTLPLRKTNSVLLGEEVGIAGFPMGNRLQGTATRPFTTRTVVAGVYDGEDSSKIKGPKIAIATSVAGGFSGGPIFSTTDAEVIGMVSSTMIEGGRWPAGISLGVLSTSIWSALVQAAASSADIISGALKTTLGKDKTAT